jgi:MoaA/NifB/PqqE/SkfB family radical SAM enzyme
MNKGNLWLYTNFDCNLRCSYCVTESSPEALRRPLGRENFCRLVDEGVALGFGDLFLTGGEPFVLPGIFDMLEYALSNARTTVLTNGVLLHGSRLERLVSVASPRLTVQVSLDGAFPEHNDGYRGAGTWARTVRAIEALVAENVHVAISTTETPDNSDHLDDLRRFVRNLGVQDGDHFVRPLAKRGFSREGQDVDRASLVPEVTVTRDGVYWHPLLAPSNTDTLVSRAIFPLAAAVDAIEAELETTEERAQGAREEFT